MRSTNAFELAHKKRTKLSHLHSAVVRQPQLSQIHFLGCSEAIFGLKAVVLRSALLQRSGSEVAQTGATGFMPKLLVAEDELCLAAQKLREKEEVLVAQGAAAMH